MSRQRLHHMPFFVADYIGATRHLTLAERGAYTDLLFLSWSIGTLPKDPARLALMICCTPKEFAKVWPAIRAKFVETEAGYVNERLEAHRRKAIEISDKRAALGKLGGEASAASRKGQLQ